jgi:DNA-binding transcriptional ArsR family regulator
LPGAGIDIGDHGVSSRNIFKISNKLLRLFFLEMTFGDSPPKKETYNIFMQPNVSPYDHASLAEVFRLIGQPIRIQILLIIGKQDACVCHIEAVTGVRQSTISQHLMVLRDAGLVTTEREGRNIFYRLAAPGLYDAIYQVAEVANISKEELTRLGQKPVANCPCPHCNPDLDPELTCKKIRTASKKTA